MLIDNGERIVSVTLNENGELEVVRRIPSNSMYACYPPRPVPDSVFKDTYHVVNGKIELKETVQGKHIPEKTIRETIEF